MEEIFMNCVQLFLQTADRLPNKVAIVFRNVEITYSQLKEQVLKFANGLIEAGITPDSHVALLMPNCPQYIISYYGVLAAGATIVPANPLYTERELSYILNHSDAQAVIYHEFIQPTIDKTKASLTLTETFIEFSEANPNCTWNQILQHEELAVPNERGIEGIAQILYTSGTTGNPKGVMLSDDNLSYMTNLLIRELGILEDDRIIVVLPIFHTLSKMAGVWAALVHGATIYLEERFVPDAILEMIERVKATVFYGVPTMFTLFTMSPRLKEIDYSSLRLFGSGGASIPVEIIERIQNSIGVPVAEAYGQTEATVMITCQPLNGERIPGSVGLPVDGIGFRIVAPDGRDVPQGEIGEIVFNGRSAMMGYYKNPEATAATIRDGWVHSGDLAYQDGHGNVFIVDRIKDMIIRGGYNIYPREIEEVLYTHPAIAECAVLGEPHEVFGEEVAAFVVTKTPISAEELQAYCQEHLAKYKIPRIFYFLDSLPKNATGKILKTPLRKQLNEKSEEVS